VSPFAFDDPSVFADVDRPILVDGELADPTAAEEVTVDEEMAADYDLRPGDTLRMQGYSFDQVDQLYEGIGSLPPEGDRFDLTVTGIVRAPQDVVPLPDVPDVVYLGSAEVHLGQAFHDAHRGVDVPSLGFLFGDVEGPGASSFELLVDFSETSEDDLKEAVRAVDPEAFFDFSGGDALRARSEAQRSIRLQAGMLLAFGTVVALGGLVLLLQAIRRQLELDRREQRSLAACGADRRTAAALAAVKGALLALVVVPVAGVVAVALSPLTPVGHARRAEVDPGLHVDWRVLLGGSVLIAALLVALPVGLAWREGAHTRRAARRTRRVVTGSEWAAQAGMSPPVVAGVRAALVSPSRWTAIVTVFAATAGIVGGLAFASSEAKLAGDAALWGWTFDAALGDGNDPGVAERAEETLAGNPLIDGYALRYQQESVLVQAGDHDVEVDASAIEDVDGSIEPRMLSGAVPRDDDEVALGGATARGLGVGVGDTVTLAASGEPQEFTVSGLVVMHLGLDADRIGEGAVLSVDGLSRITEVEGPSFALVEYADGADADEVYGALRDDWGNTVLQPVRGVDVEQLHAVRHLPVWFSAFLATVAVATLLFVLVVTIRRRRRDLAVLRTLGFDRRHVRSTVLAQALTLVLPSAVIGSVVGLAGGRVAWSLTAQSLGAPEVQATPIAALLAVLAAAAGVAVAVALVPGHLAGRIRPAAVLRAE
jgi:ABC-type lipoprotein release transport system permease subunit